MIINKQMPEYPNYYMNWDYFKQRFPQETDFIYAEFVKICRSHNVVFGKPVLMDILNNRWYIRRKGRG
jgi:hypothetical protein